MKYIGALFMFLVLTNNVNGQIGCPLKIINSDNDCIYDGLKTDEDGKIVYSYHKQYGKIFDFYEFNSDGICISCAYTFQTFDDYSEFIKILESKTYSTPHFLDHKKYKCS